MLTHRSDVPDALELKIRHSCATEWKAYFHWLSPTSLFSLFSRLHQGRSILALHAARTAWSRCLALTANDFVRARMGVLENIFHATFPCANSPPPPPCQLVPFPFPSQNVVCARCTALLVGGEDLDYSTMGVEVGWSKHNTHAEQENRNSPAWSVHTDGILVRVWIVSKVKTSSVPPSELAGKDSQQPSLTTRPQHTNNNFLAIVSCRAGESYFLFISHQCLRYLFFYWNAMGTKSKTVSDTDNKNVSRIWSLLRVCLLNFTGKYVWLTLILILCR